MTRIIEASSNIILPRPLIFFITRIIAASSDIILLRPTFSHIINLIRVINTRSIRMLEFYSHRVQIFIHSYRLSSNYIWSRHFGIS